MITRFFLICFLGALSGPNAHGAGLFGLLEGAAIIFDAQIENPPENSGLRVLSPPSGGQVAVQMFVPAAAGFRTIGYNIHIDLVGGAFSDHIGSISGTAFDGSEIFASGNTISALMPSAPTVPPGGYIGQIVLSVKSPIPEGGMLAAKAGSMGDISAQNDALNTRNAVVTFANVIEPVPGDFNLDGRVDFADFLTFTTNFGTVGPVPTPVSPTSVIYVPDTTVVIDTIINTIVDTLVQVDTLTVVVRDTLRLTTEIRDTVVVPLDPAHAKPVFSGLATPMTYSDRVAVALDADTRRAFDNANATNGLEVQIICRSNGGLGGLVVQNGQLVHVPDPLGGIKEYQFTIQYDPAVLEFYDFVDPPLSDRSFLSTHATVTILDPGQLLLRLSMQSQDDFSRTGAFGNIRFKRIAKSDTQVKMIKAEALSAKNDVTRVVEIHSGAITLTWPFAQ